MGTFASARTHPCGIEHHRRAADRLGGRDALRQLALGDVLDAVVDRQLDAATLDGRIRHAGGEHLPAARVAIRLDVVRLAADGTVELALEAFESLRVDADEAEDVGGERAVRIEPAYSVTAYTRAARGP